MPAMEIVGLLGLTLASVSYIGEKLSVVLQEAIKK